MQEEYKQAKGTVRFLLLLPMHTVLSLRRLLILIRAASVLLLTPLPPLSPTPSVSSLPHGLSLLGCPLRDEKGGE